MGEASMKTKELMLFLQHIEHIQAESDHKITVFYRSGRRVAISPEQLVFWIHPPGVKESSTTEQIAKWRGHDLENF